MLLCRELDRLGPKKVSFLQQEEATGIMNARCNIAGWRAGFFARCTAGRPLLLALLAASALAQIAGSGSIQGVIVDPSGAAIPGVNVTVTNTGTGVKTERATTMTPSGRATVL